MKVLARFIGIDKYRHSLIRDLNGAERDALALYSLFKDSVPNSDCEVLLSGDAGKSKIDAALQATLGEATEGDVALFYFAGHGSPDHRLIAVDSDPANHLETSISMEEIANAFRSTRARVAICILDCCFSGGASARVFKDVPLTRKGVLVDTASFTGSGRVLLSAASWDESAYEHPASRHGLFTKSLLDALLQGEGDFDLSVLASDVLARVRAEAARMGVQQTPVFFGEIIGGLGLPKLRAGATYASAFPETVSPKISECIADLASCGIPGEVTENWTSLYPKGLNQLQMDAVNEIGILRGNSALVVAPTSAGKTFIGEMAAVKAFTEGRKAVFLLPYKALVNEKFDQFGAVYGSALGYRVVRCTGDFQDQTSEVMRGKYDLAIFTYEMFLNLVVANPHILNQLGLVVIDEAQFVTDPSRGISLELLLTLLLAARERSVEPQIVCLSAVIGGLNSFDEWLGCSSLVRTDRPVALVEGVIDRSGTWQFRDEDGTVREEQILPFVRQRKEKPSAQDVIVPLVAKLVAEGEQVIVFRNQKGSAQGCARYLAQDLNLPSSIGVVEELPEHDQSSASTDLRFCLQNGTAFHTSNLVRDERAVIERAFRDPKRNVRVLGATTTVAAGINTPASTVVIAEQEFRGDDGREFTVAEYKNMAGRAGRLGYNEKGKSIIYAETPHQRRLLFQKYVMGAPEPITSSFDTNHVDTWALRLLAQVDAVDREGVPILIANTFGGFLLIKRNPGSREALERQVEEVLTRMLALDLAENDNGRIRLTLLGRACGRSALTFQSALKLVDMVRSLDPSRLTAETLLCILQALPESDGGYTPMVKKGTSEAVRPQQAARRFGDSVVALLQRGARDQLQYCARCKRAAILGDWIDGTPLDQIERRFSPNPYQGTITAGTIRSFADATRLYHRAAFDISIIVHPNATVDVDEVELLLKRLEVGLPKDALPILDFLPDLNRGACLELWKQGFTSLTKCATLAFDALMALIGKREATRIHEISDQLFEAQKSR